MFQETMTPFERFESLHETGFADRPGAFVLASGFVPRMVGNLTMKECYECPIRYARAFLSVQQMLGFDSGPLFGYPAFGVKEFGGRVSYPRNNSKTLFPVITRKPINEPEDVDRLEVPDPNRAGDIPKMMAGIKYVMDSFPEGYRNPILVTGDTFTWAGNLVGLDTLLMWIQDQPELARTILNKVSDFEVELVKYALAHVGDLTFFDGASSDSNDLISARQFEKYALPPLQSYRQRALRIGARKFICHPCGNQTKNTRLWAQVPGTYAINFDFRTPLETCVSLFGKDMTIIGNIECLQFILGEPEWMYERAMGKLRSAATRCPRGYMVGPGCELPAESSPVNVHAMIRAARDFAETPEWREARR